MGISAESLFYFSIREFCEKNVSKLLDKVKPSLVISSLCNFFYLKVCNDNVLTWDTYFSAKKLH